MNHDLTRFPPATFVLRRERLAESIRDGVMILPAAPLLHRSRDTEYRYRPDSELYYLTGCTDPGVVAVLGPAEAGSGPCLTLFVPERDPDREIWSGPRMGPEEALERLGADAAHPFSELGSRLPGLLREPRKIYCRLGVHPEVDRLVTRAMQDARTRGARKGTGPRLVADPGVLLDPLRMRKDPREVAVIRSAVDLTVAGFREALAGVGEGVGEWEVEARLEGVFRQRGGAGAAFPTIVGSGENACVLHYARNEAVIPEGALVLVDGGAELNLYAGDLTRTVPAAGGFRGAQRDVYQLVLDARNAAMSQVRPGDPVSGIHGAATEVLTDGLLALGVLAGHKDDLMEDEAWKRLFPHQTSHWLGLDVHDVGDYARGGESVMLEPGMVLTVEPGLYFSQEMDGIPDHFKGIGVRIEDDLLVTEDGVENLSAALPVSPEEVEGMVRGGGPDRLTE